MSDHPAEWLSAYMDDELDREQRQSVERHLAECMSCRALLSELKDIQSQVSTFYLQAEAPDDLERRVLEALDDKPAAPAMAKTRAALIPIAGVVILFVILILYRSIWLKTFSVLFKVTVTAVYVISHIISSVPALWISILAIAVGLSLISGLSLRRILRSSAQ